MQPLVSMGKKNYSSGQSSSKRIQSSFTDADMARLTINGFEDVADSEDEFYLNKDKVIIQKEDRLKKSQRLQQQGRFLFT